MVRTLVRRLAPLAIVMLAVGIFAVPAGAQTEPPVPCTFTEIRPPSVPAGTYPVVIDIEGKAPAGATVRAFVNGNQVQQTIAVEGFFTFTGITIPTAQTAVTVNYDNGQGNAYATGCQGGIEDPGTGIRVSGANVARGLAFTGSSNTLTNVLIGLGALALGTVLVVATRRRRAPADV